jgi:hypothetical protein
MVNNGINALSQEVFARSGVMGVETTIVGRNK